MNPQKCFPSPAIPAEQLDNPMPDTPASRLVAMFGGVRAMAAATGIDKATISRAQSNGPRNTGGKFPPQYNDAILIAARAAGVSERNVRACLDFLCPECGRKMPAR
mgnify:CR=1 FL=1